MDIGGLILRCSRGLASVLIGDFNIFNMSKYRGLYDGAYKASNDKYEYISYPKDNDSLDYVLIPLSYEFESFICRDEYVSDHRMVVTKIKLPSLS